MAGKLLSVDEFVNKKGIKEKETKSVPVSVEEFSRMNSNQTANVRQTSVKPISIIDKLLNGGKDYTNRITQNRISSPITDRTGYIKDFNTSRDLGILSQTDPKKMNRLQLNNFLLSNQTKYNKAKEKEEAYKNKTEEEKQADQENLRSAHDNRSRWDYVFSKGIPYDEDDYGYYLKDDSAWNDPYNKLMLNRPEDYYDAYTTTQQGYDRLLYDALHGKGAYDTRVDQADSYEEIDELDAYMESLWDSFERREYPQEYYDIQQGFDTAAEEVYGNYGSEKYKRNIDAANKQIETLDKADEYIRNAPEPVEGFVPDYKQNKKTYNTTGQMVLGGIAEMLNPSVGDEVDNIYNVMTTRSRRGNPWNNVFTQDQIFGEDAITWEEYNTLQPAQFMNDEQRRAFEGYYSNGDRQSALEFYKVIEPGLKQIMLEAKDKYEEVLSQDNYSSVMIGKRIAEKPYADLTGAAGVVAATFGYEPALDPDNEFFYGGTRTAENIQNARAQVWGNYFAEHFGDFFKNITGDENSAENVGKWLNGVFYSVADNVTRRAIGMGFSSMIGLDQVSDVAGSIIQGLASGGAASSEMLKGLREGADPTETLARAYAGAVIEWVTEKYSTDRFFENYGKGSFARQMVANFLPEAQEEMAGKVLETFTDEILSGIYGHESEFRQKVAQYTKEFNGDEKKAWERALWDYVGELGAEGLAGGLAGAFGGGVGALQASMTYNQENESLGGKVMESGANIDATAEEQAETGKANIQAVVSAASKMGKNTNSRAKALKLQKEIDAGKEVSKKEVGELTRTIIEETNEQIGSTVQNVLGNTIEEELVQKGVKKKNLPILRDTLTGMIIRGEYTLKGMEAVASSPEAQEVLQEYGMKDSAVRAAAEETDTKVQEPQSIQDEVVGLLSDNNAEVSSKVEEMTADAPVASQSDIVMAKGKRTNSGTEVITDGQIADIESVETQTTDDGTKLVINLKNGTQVDALDVKAVTPNVAKALRFASVDGNKLGSDRFTNVLISNAPNIRDMDAAIGDAMKIRIDTLTGRKGTTSTRLSNRIVTEIRNATMADFEESENKRVSSQRKIKPGQGKATYKGAEFGSKPFTDAIRDLPKEIRTEAYIVGELAKAGGFDVEMTYDPETIKTQGSFSTGNGIMINLAGENAGGSHHSALVTLAHEITHQLEAGSREAYANLRSFVFDSLAKEGVNVAQRVQNIMDNYAHQGVEIDLNGAIAEMVAQGCDQILSNEETIQSMRKSDPSLYGKIRNVIKNLVDRIRKVIGSIRGSMSYESRNLQNYMEELSKKWNLAYEEAKGTQGDTAAAQKGGDNSQYALRNIPIDEESIQKNRTKISQMPAIRAKSNPIFAIGPELKSNVKAYYKSMQNHVPSKVFGDIQITNSKISESFGHGMTPLKAAAYAFLPEVLKNGEVADYVELFEDDNFDSAILAAPVEITDGPLKGEYYIGAVVKLYRDGSNRYYTHDGIVAIKNIGDGTTTTFDPVNSTSSATKKQEYTGKNKGGNHHTIESILDQIPKRNIKSGKTQNSLQDDADYMAAVKSGDMDTAQRMVIQVAKNAGYTDEAYHGTDKKHGFGFTVFDMEESQGMIFVAYDDVLAKTYTRSNAEVRDIISRGKTIYDLSSDDFDDFAIMNNHFIENEDGEKIKTKVMFNRDGTYELRTKPKSYGEQWGSRIVTENELRNLLKDEYAAKSKEGVYRLYTKPGNQLVIDAEDNNWNDIPFEPYGKATTRQIAQWAKDNGYDSVRINNVYDNGGRSRSRTDGEDGYGDIGIFFNQGDVKSADTVTYDDQGNIIPPSERFNTKNQDIRFSMQDPVEVDKDGLIAVHNLGEEQLLAAIRLGGFAMPSIAIIKNDYAHNRYGDISVVFYPNTIDPKASKSNKVYSGDAWTPVYPAIEYKVNTKELSKIYKKVRSLVPETIKGSNGFIELYDEQFENALNSARGDVIAATDRNMALQIAYLTEKGKDINYPTREETLDGFGKFKNDQVLYVLDKLGADKIREAYDGGYEYIDNHPELTEQIRNALNEQWIEKHKNIALQLAKKPLYDADKFGTGYVNQILEAANKYLQNGIDQRLDEYKLRDMLEEMVDKDGYEAWRKELFKNVIEKSGIRNNKDYYTNTGNRRSWDALHDEETLDNVVRAMKGEADKGANAFFSQSEMLALGTKSFTSLKDIRAHKNQLKHMTDEEISALKTDIVNGFSELMDEMYDRKESNIFIARDRALQAMVEAVRKSRNAAGIMRELRQWYGLNLTDDMGQRIANLVKQIEELPTEYFEAKPQRAVYFDEIAKVIVPETASQELLSAMEQNGIPYETYDGTDEGRLQALNNQTDAQFSMQDIADQEATYWMGSVNRDSLQTEAEKMLLDNFRNLQMRIELKRKQIEDIRSKIREIERTPAENRTPEQQRMLKNLNIKMQNATSVKDQATAELAKITSDKGYARVMQEQNRIFNSFIYGKTQAEVRDAVQQMQKGIDEITRRIAQTQQELAEIEKGGVVAQLKKILGTTTADKVAAEMKQHFHSSWTKNQIRNYLDPILIKMAAGEDFTQDAQTLAEILVNNDERNTYEGLSALQGLKIVVGHGMMEELHANDSTLREIRERLRGTGISVRAAKKVGGHWEGSTLESDIESLRAEYPGMPDFGNEKDALENFVSWVEGMKPQQGGIEFYDEKLADALAFVMQKAAGVAHGIQLPNDTKAQKRVLAMYDFVRGLNAKTEAAEKTLKDIADEMAGMKKANEQAVGMANVLTQNVGEAIRYYDRTAKLAMDTAKQRKQSAIIEQLKSKQAEKIAKNNEEWRNLIERDRQARNIAELNARKRNVINTDIKRMYRLLRDQSTTKNMPEYMQALARAVIDDFVSNDLTGQKVLRADPEQLAEAKRLLIAWTKQNGPATYGEIMDRLEDAEEAVGQALMLDRDAYQLALQEWNSEIKGKNKLDIIRKRGEILNRMQQAVSEIYGAIQAERTVQANQRKVKTIDQAYKVMQSAGGKKYREWTGKRGAAISALHKAIVSGNMTPEYFFRTIGNAGLTDLWENYHAAENRRRQGWRRSRRSTDSTSGT